MTKLHQAEEVNQQEQFQIIHIIECAPVISSVEQPVSFPMQFKSCPVD